MYLPESRCSRNVFSFYPGTKTPRVPTGLGPLFPRTFQLAASEILFEEKRRDRSYFVLLSVRRLKAFSYGLSLNMIRAPALNGSTVCITKSIGRYTCLTARPTPFENQSPRLDPPRGRGRRDCLL